MALPLSPAPGRRPLSRHAPRWRRKTRFRLQITRRCDEDEGAATRQFHRWQQQLRQTIRKDEQGLYALAQRFKRDLFYWQRRIGKDIVGNHGTDREPAFLQLFGNGIRCLPAQRHGARMRDFKIPGDVRVDKAGIVTNQPALLSE
jgi:hypothetical protein